MSQQRNILVLAGSIMVVRSLSIVGSLGCSKTSDRRITRVTSFSNQSRLWHSVYHDTTNRSSEMNRHLQKKFSSKSKNQPSVQESPDNWTIQPDSAPVKNRSILHGCQIEDGLTTYAPVFLEYPRMGNSPINH